MAYFDIHYADALLNVYIKDYPRLKVDRVATHALYHVICKLEGVVDMCFDNILEELM